MLSRYYQSIETEHYQSRFLMVEFLESQPGDQPTEILFQKSFLLCHPLRILLYLREQKLFFHLQCRKLQRRKVQMTILVIKGKFIIS